mmetsp:Transcript_6482/g.13350  ORF Transcript_6482/g.13350 Transcript_6482/m.13350 type:complete len:280 (-) Transcript_6482:82-921(-)
MQYRPRHVQGSYCKVSPKASDLQGLHLLEVLAVLSALFLLARGAQVAEGAIGSAPAALLVDEDTRLASASAVELGADGGQGRRTEERLCDGLTEAEHNRLPCKRRCSAAFQCVLEAQHPGCAVLVLGIPKHGLSHCQSRQRLLHLLLRVGSATTAVGLAEAAAALGVGGHHAQRRARPSERGATSGEHGASAARGVSRGPPAGILPDKAGNRPTTIGGNATAAWAACDVAAEHVCAEQLTTLATTTAGATAGAQPPRRKPLNSPKSLPTAALDHRSRRL